MQREQTENPSLLTGEDTKPVTVLNEHGHSRVVLTCEHAGREIPVKLGDLGIAVRDRDRHIAWDIGAAETARHISTILDAPLIQQSYSRLVIDCNRPIGASDSIPETSDGSMIPGNKNLVSTDRQSREKEIHHPYHARIEDILRAREQQVVQPLLISIHTFTPMLDLERDKRPWDMGLLYNRDDRLASSMDQVLDSMDHGFQIAHNEPYSVCDETDYTLPVHGENRGIHNVLLEVRNDHVSDSDGCRYWGDFLSRVIASVEETEHA